LPKTPSIDKFREIIANNTTIDQFMMANGGELVRIFAGAAEDADAAAGMVANNQLNAEILEKYPGVKKIVKSSLKNFINYIKTTELYDIDYKYLWDIICAPGFLFEDGLNLVILEIPNTDITGNVDIICPVTTYSSVPLYDPRKETAILIKSGRLYEPIFVYENRRDSVIIKKTYHPSTSAPAFKRVLETIMASTNRHCSPIKTIDFVRPIQLAEIARVLGRVGGGEKWKIEKKIVNYYGNIIGLYISSADGAAPAGVIPCAPFQNHLSVLKETPVVMMDADADEIGWKDYETTLEFLRTVARETGLPFRPVTKIIEDGLITGVLTETNQFISLDAPVQNKFGKDDGLYPIQSSNFIGLERDFLETANQDQERINTTKMISLESQFYSAFRSLARKLLNSFEFLAERKRIAKLLGEKKSYREKLRIVEIELREIMEGYVEFIDFSEKVLLSIDSVSSCETNCDKKEFCMLSTNNECKLLLPRQHLLHKSENQIIYFARLADEIIRYKRIQTFMFNKNTFLNLSNIKYSIFDNEIILLENNIKSGDYFENLTPEKYNITYQRARPAGIEIPQLTITLEDQDKLLAPPAAAAAATEEESAPAAGPGEVDIQENIRSCIKETLNHVKGNVKSKWVYLFPNKCREVFFQETDNKICSFAPIIYILQSVFNRQLTITAVKEKLANIYSSYTDAATRAAIYKIFYMEGKRDLAAKLEAGQITIEDAIIEENYYLTNIDLWVFFNAIELPVYVVLFSAFTLKNISPKDQIDWLLFSKLKRKNVDGTTREKFVFIRSPTNFSPGVIPTYSIVTPQIEMTQMRAEFQEEFGEAIETGSNNVLKLEDYLATAAITAQKKRRRVILK
jgi:hypothetical protein